VTIATVGGLLAGAAVVLASAFGPAPTAGAQEAGGGQDGDGRLTVMGRNLYLGADVGVALELLPDMSAAAQFMWDQVAATDFDARVTSLAAEAARYNPDVIGLQEATVWSCRPQPWSAPQPVFDFTTQFLEATEAAGVPYVVAEDPSGSTANNPGYAIPAIPFLTTVEDPETFQPLFGTDTADCGFTVGDALLVRADLTDSVQAAGTSEYDARYAVAPVVFTIDRGYAWADLAVEGTTVRVVTTHLESLFPDEGLVPGAVQAQQLVEDLANVPVPLLVMGDFNADPRDPRGPEDPNPAGQPSANDACPAQPADVSGQDADATCNAYWTMLAAGFTDSGPDPLEPANRTWGAAADLAGPDPERLPVAIEQGNDDGFTERLDYVFTRNGATPVSAEVIGNTWPDGDDLWACDDPSQVQTTQESAQILADAGLGEPITGRGICLPTDHAGIVAVVDVSGGPDGTVAVAAPESHESVSVGLLGWLGIILGVLLLLLVLLIWGVVALVRRRRSRRRAG